MNESLLKSLISLFSIVVETEEGAISESAHRVIANFLRKEFSREQVEEYLAEVGFNQPNKSTKGGVSNRELTLSQRIDIITNKINSEFEQHQKVWLTLQLVEFIADMGYQSEQQLVFIHSIAKGFNIPDEEFTNGMDFILATNSDQIQSNKHIIKVDNDSSRADSPEHIYKPNFEGILYFIHIPSTNTLLLKYFGDSNVFLNSKALKPGRAYIFGAGGVIRCSRVEPIYFSKIAGVFFQSWRKTNIRISADSIEYKHKGSKDGVHPFTFDAHSGQLIAIMGGSGVGKSTLINLLNGNLKPASGQILINGYDIHKNKKELQGVVGFVPQDDLLVEDLTVYQNLYYGAKFCFSEKNEKEIEELVNETLKDFDLNEARDLKVGNPVNKFISGGQRKRLNIAMELIREPAILFVDEPTSGLSSFDSERIILMLKRQTFKGKIVIANVHQPSSDIYKLFDKLLVMDQGGRVIYQGNPMDAVVYFKHEGQFLKADESECLSCGNVNTEQILRIIEARVVNEYGKLTRKRKRSATEWYEMYLERIQSKIRPTTHTNRIQLPQNNFSTPTKGKQSWLFFQRNLLSKLANRQFMLIALLEAPLLALVLGFFSKYISGTLNNPDAYIYSQNDNIPSFLFMSVVAALFMGLTISAEEIIRDQKVRQREKFLNLSYFSYINSKIITLLFFSAFQTLLFTAMGNYILEIQGHFLSTWVILFSTAVCANLIGLNISSALNSVVTIYITIPLILIPMLLLSGVVVSYDRLHKSILHQEYVPLVGDVNPIRWAYEALCVHQFKRNKFNRHFYRVDRQISNNTYYATFLVPKLQIKLDDISKSILIGKVTPNTRRDLMLLQAEIGLLYRDYPVSGIVYPDTSLLNPNRISRNEVDVFINFFSTFREKLFDTNRALNLKRDSIYNGLVEKHSGADQIFALKRTYHNNALEDIVLKKNEIEKIVVGHTRHIRKFNPVYAMPTATNGRAQMFAPLKRVGSIKIDTLLFNILVLWVMSAVMYIALLTNMLRAINSYLERFKFRRLAKRISRYIPI
jgi:ABC-type multidrug transport system ATPase subunit